ncbi:hypothetical protein [Pseudoalteromonas sp. T1lg23B]|uniref:hypothetical protein n=1 Tax=Pseudoalteromonas sp. T1lg23B TaxID=2077097 RepID=UPI000CF60351|nr:hypothetical protein [Pseudoalteromonas sp. T1lg23B]
MQFKPLQKPSNQTQTAAQAQSALSAKPLIDNRALQAAAVSSNVQPIQRKFDDSDYNDVKAFIAQWRTFEQVAKLKPKHCLSDSALKEIHLSAKNSFYEFDIRDLFNHRSDIDSYILSTESSVEDEQGDTHAIGKHVAVDDEYLHHRVKTEARVDKATRFTKKSKAVKAMQNWQTHGDKVLTEYGYVLGRKLADIIEERTKKNQQITPPILAQQIRNAGIGDAVDIAGYTLELVNQPVPARANQMWGISCRWKAVTEKEYAKREVTEDSTEDVYAQATIFPPNGADLVVRVQDDGLVHVLVPENIMGTFF